MDIRRAVSHKMSENFEAMGRKRVLGVGERINRGKNGEM